MLRRAGWGIVALLLAAVPTLAQPARASTDRVTLRGLVRDAEGRALAGARITTAGVKVDVESEDDGSFTVPGLPAGSATIVVRRIGFAPETLAVPLGQPTASPLVVSLKRLALPLDAVVVRGRSDLRGPIAGFYARMERGNGRFFTLEQIQRSGARRMSDLLRGIPGLRLEQRRYGVQSIRMRGAAIAPLIWLDGTPMGAGEVDLDNFDPRSFAGIEIYSGPATVPAQFGGSRTMSTSGGTIILWTRQGELAPPRRPRGAASPALLIAGLLEREEVYTKEAVDRPAQPSDGARIIPVYPDSLYVARQPGRVEVEFVVDASGRVRMDTFGVVTTTHRALSESVRRALLERSWSPARREGQAVSQLVQLPFEFLPDSSAIARKPKD